MSRFLRFAAKRRDIHLRHVLPALGGHTELVANRISQARSIFTFKYKGTILIRFLAIFWVLTSTNAKAFEILEAIPYDTGTTKSVGLASEQCKEKLVGATAYIFGARATQYKGTTEVCKKHHIPFHDGMGEMLLSGYSLKTTEVSRSDYYWTRFAIVDVDSVPQIQILSESREQSIEASIVSEVMSKFPTDIVYFGSHSTPKPEDMGKVIIRISYTGNTFSLINVECWDKNTDIGYGYYSTCKDKQGDSLGQYLYQYDDRSLFKIKAGLPLGNPLIVAVDNGYVIYGHESECKSCGVSKAFYIKENNSIQILTGIPTGT